MATPRRPPLTDDLDDLDDLDGDDALGRLGDTSLSSFSASRTQLAPFSGPALYTGLLVVRA